MIEFILALVLLWIVIVIYLVVKTKEDHLWSWFWLIFFPPIVPVILIAKGVVYFMGPRRIKKMRVSNQSLVKPDDSTLMKVWHRYLDICNWIKPPNVKKYVSPPPCIDEEVAEGEKVINEITGFAAGMMLFDYMDRHNRY